MDSGTQQYSDRRAVSRAASGRRGLGIAFLLTLLTCLGAASALADAPPAVTIEAPSAVDFDSAQLSGTVDPQGGPSETFWHFEYTTTPGEEASWAQVGENESAGSGSGAVPVEASLGGLAPGTEYFVRLRASNEEGANSVLSEVKSFETEAVNPPEASGLAVSAITASSAHFKGTVNSGGSGEGEASNWQFECSPGCPTLEGEFEGATNSGANVEPEADAAGLEPHTEYTVTLRIADAAGLSAEDSETFATDAVAPEAVTLANKGPVAATSAYLIGKVNPRNSQTSYWFEYGPADCASNPCQSFPAGQDADAGAGNSLQIVAQSVSGLSPATTYHYRLVADNGTDGPVAGIDRVFTTASAPTPQGPCPNEAIRIEQGSTYLPDCRAYEMITPADKNETQAFVTSPISPDGNRVLYDIVGGYPGSATEPGTLSGAHPQLLATRTASGWKSKDILAPPAQWPGQVYMVGFVNPDVTGAIVSSFDGIGTPGTSPNVSVLRLGLDNTQTMLHPFPQYFGASGVELVASDDLSHVFVNVPRGNDPALPGYTAGDKKGNVFDLGGAGTPELVSRMPATGLAPTCGVPRNNNPIGFVTSAQADDEHWSSTDGSRVFFQTVGDDAPDCDDPLELYMRDLDTATTTRISGPVVVGDPDLGVERFLQATPDGSLVTYRTPTSFDPSDDVDGINADQDIYQWTEAGGNVCLTCVVENAAVATQSGRAAVSEDGSHVYFSSTRKLAGAPTTGNAGGPNLYVWHGGTIDWIARTNGVSNRPIGEGDLTPDGNVLIFRSFRPELNALTGSDNGGLFQIYRYDDRDASIACVSCPPGGGVAPEVESPVLAASRQAVQPPVRTVSDDGSTVAFVTSEALVSRDVNQRPDIYEWRDGAIGLITSGRVDYPRFIGPEIVTLSADGRDLLFKEIGRLTPDAQGDSIKLYDARVGGGFPAPPTPPAPCAGEGCQSPAAPQPAPLAAGSDAFAGAGNAKPKRPKHKHHRKKRHQKRAQRANHDHGGNR